jgi:hypothetical protein
MGSDTGGIPEPSRTCVPVGMVSASLPGAFKRQEQSKPEQFGWQSENRKEKRGWEEQRS